MTEIFAHRGASGYAPENTMDAFKLAVKQGAEGIELDVQLSKDGIPVVIHDETIDRVTNGHGYVNDKNYGFNVVNVNSTELVVFEAAIDLMSYVDIFTDYESNKLALGMLADAPLETFLREHPQITSIRFCLDGDEPGRKAAAELMRKYYELGYEVEDCPPPAGYKDYNEWLVAAKLNLNQMNQRADEPVRA